MQAIESEGKSVTEAVESALKKMGLRRDQVEVQILQEGSSGFMGIGAKPARVKLTEKRWGPESAVKAPERPRPHAPEPSRSHAPARGASSVRTAPPPQPSPRHASEDRAAAEKASAAEPKAACAEAQSLAQELLGMMQFKEAAAAASWDAPQERVKLSVSGADAERLIGPEGKTLEALQFLMTLMLNRRLNASVAVQVDVDGYWEKREQDILARAQKSAEEVKRTGKAQRLEPMDALTRRLVHRHLASHPDVVTASEGEGLWRKIVLRPRKS